MRDVIIGTHLDHLSQDSSRFREATRLDQRRRVAKCVVRSVRLNLRCTTIIIERSRRVVCTINDSESFQCALLPSDGDFVIVVNKVKRDKLKIGEGDPITVELAKDDSKYGLPMPAEFKEVLNQDPGGNKVFHSLTPGKQRSILYLIGKVKDIDKRIHTALVVIEHLKKNEGKIIGDQLQIELKRPIF